jgi:hypothetical protein
VLKILALKLDSLAKSKNTVILETGDGATPAVIAIPKLDLCNVASIPNHFPLDTCLHILSAFSISNAVQL